MRRIVSGSLAAVAAGWALTSCTVPIDGVTGVTVDGSGGLRGVISSCKHRIDSAVLYRADGPDAADLPSLGYWDLHGDSTRGPLTWSLTRRESPAASASTTPLPMLEHRKMSLYGATRNNSWSTGDVTFRLAETRRLHPGQILVLDIDSIDEQSERNVVVDVAEFRRLACAD